MDLESEDSALHKLSSLQIFKIVDFVHIGYKLWWESLLGCLLKWCVGIFRKASEN